MRGQEGVLLRYVPRRSKRARKLRRRQNYDPRKRDLRGTSTRTPPTIASEGTHEPSRTSRRPHEDTTDSTSASAYPSWAKKPSFRPLSAGGWNVGRHALLFRTLEIGKPRDSSPPDQSNARAPTPRQSREIGERPRRQSQCVPHIPGAQRAARFFSPSTDHPCSNWAHSATNSPQTLSGSPCSTGGCTSNVQSR